MTDMFDVRVCVCVWMCRDCWLHYVFALCASFCSLCNFQISWLPDVFFCCNCCLCFYLLQLQKYKMLTQTPSPSVLQKTTGLKLLECVSWQVSHSWHTYSQNCHASQFLCHASVSWQISSMFVSPSVLRSGHEFHHHEETSSFNITGAWIWLTNILAIIFRHQGCWDSKFHLSRQDWWGDIQRVIIIMGFCIKLAPVYK